MWQLTRDITYYAREIWTGMYSGLYGVTAATHTTDPECFGEWIPNDMEFIVHFFHGLGKNIWMATYEDSTQVAYDIVDLLFLNDQYCHFRLAVYDVVTYCELENKPCSPGLILGNL